MGQSPIDKWEGFTESRGLSITGHGPTATTCPMSLSLLRFSTLSLRVDEWYRFITFYNYFPLNKGVGLILGPELSASSNGCPRKAEYFHPVPVTGFPSSSSLGDVQGSAAQVV